MSFKSPIKETLTSKFTKLPTITTSLLIGYSETNQVIDLVEVPLPPDQNQVAFETVTEMLNQKYADGFSYVEWIEEVKVEVQRALPTPLTVVACCVKGQT